MHVKLGQEYRDSVRLFVCRPFPADGSWNVANKLQNQCKTCAKLLQRQAWALRNTCRECLQVVTKPSQSRVSSSQVHPPGSWTLVDSLQLLWILTFNGRYHSSNFVANGPAETANLMSNVGQQLLSGVSCSSYAVAHVFWKPHLKGALSGLATTVCLQPCEQWDSCAGTTKSDVDDAGQSTFSRRACNRETGQWNCQGIWYFQLQHYPKY